MDELKNLTLKAPITTAADDNFDLIFFFHFVFHRKLVSTFHVNPLPRNVKTCFLFSFFFSFFVFQRKQVLVFHVNHLPGKTYFLRKIIKEKMLQCSLL